MRTGHVRTFTFAAELSNELSTTVNHAVRNADKGLLKRDENADATSVSGLPRPQPANAKRMLGDLIEKSTTFGDGGAHACR